MHREDKFYQGLEFFKNTGSRTRWMLLMVKEDDLFFIRDKRNLQVGTYPSNKINHYEFFATQYHSDKNKEYLKEVYPITKRVLKAKNYTYFLIPTSKMFGLVNKESTNLKIEDQKITIKLKNRNACFSFNAINIKDDFLKAVDKFLDNRKIDGDWVVDKTNLKLRKIVGYDKKYTNKVLNNVENLANEHIEEYQKKHSTKFDIEAVKYEIYKGFQSSTEWTDDVNRFFNNYSVVHKNLCELAINFIAEKKKKKKA